MANLILGNSPNIYDASTGRQVGAIGYDGNQYLGGMVQQYPTYSSLPSASNFGVGVAQAADTGMLYTTTQSGFKGISWLRNIINNAAKSNAIKNGIISTPPTITSPTVFDVGLPTAWSYNANPNSFNILGGSIVINDPLGGFTHVSNNLGSIGPMILEFCTDAPALQFAGANGVYKVQVDGQYISSVGITPGNAAPYYLFKLDWGGVRKFRTYRIICGYWFAGIYTDANSIVINPDTTQISKWLFLGDSYMQGINAAYADNMLQMWACELLGVRDVNNIGFGGAGYVAVGTGGPFINALPTLVTAQPDVIVIAGGTNDTGQPSATISANVITLLKAIRSALPFTKVIVTGVWPASSGPSAQKIADETTIQAAVSTANIGASFIPICNDSSGSWIFGTGWNGSGTGNSNFYIGAAGDSVHPNDAGHQYLGNRLAEAIRKVI